MSLVGLDGQYLTLFNPFCCVFLNVCVPTATIRETNPFTGEPFATQQEIERCKPAGEISSQRLFNPLETSWCRDFALDSTNPKQDQEQVLWRGPFVRNVNDHGNGGLHQTINVGRGVFDRRYVNHCEDAINSMTICIIFCL